VVEQIARGWMSISGVIKHALHRRLMIAQHGTDEQKQRFAAEDGDGEIRGAILDERARMRLGTSRRSRREPLPRVTSSSSTARRCG